MFKDLGTFWKNWKFQIQVQVFKDLGTFRKFENSKESTSVFRTKYISENLKILNKSISV